MFIEPSDKVSTIEFQDQGNIHLLALGIWMSGLLIFFVVINSGE